MNNRVISSFLLPSYCAGTYITIRIRVFSKILVIYAVTYAEPLEANMLRKWHSIPLSLISCMCWHDSGQRPTPQPGSCTLYSIDINEYRTYCINIQVAMTLTKTFLETEEGHMIGALSDPHPASFSPRYTY